MANNILKGKRGIIFGALDNKSIAWKVAEHAHAEGAKFVLTNAPIALRMGTINELAEQTGSKVIPADATSMEDLKALYRGAIVWIRLRAHEVPYRKGHAQKVLQRRHRPDGPLSTLKLAKDYQQARKRQEMALVGCYLVATRNICCPYKMITY